MRVSDLEFRTDANAAELSANISGLRVHFRFSPEEAIEPWGGPFLVLALPEAMGRHEPLTLDSSLPVSPVLLEHVADIQEIYHCWNPDLKPIPIECTSLNPPPSREGVSAFYSGGIDSAYTFLSHQEEITHLVHIEGFDHIVPAAEAMERTAHRRQFAERYGKSFVRVATNYREYSEARKVQWFLVHGNLLAAICLAMGFRRSYIPSTHSYAQLFPWGSHPLVDPLWSNGRTQVVHDGSGAARTDKTRRIAECREVLDDLTVCWKDSQRNCGTCTKCLRAMITLHLLGVSTPAFPPLASPRQIRNMTCEDQNERAFLLENLALAHEVGNRAVEGQLKALLRRFETQSLIAELDGLVLGHALRGLYRRIRKPEWLDLEVTLTRKE